LGTGLHISHSHFGILSILEHLGGKSSHLTFLSKAIETCGKAQEIKPSHLTLMARQLIQQPSKLEQM
jgi:hypothetical protein